MQATAIDEQIMQFVKQRMAEGAESVTRGDILAAIVPPEHRENRYRPEYKQALERLYRVGKLHAVRGRDGEMRYSIETDD